MDDFVSPRRPKLKLTEDKDTRRPTPKETGYLNDEPAFVEPDKVAEHESLTEHSEEHVTTKPKQKGLFGRRINVIPKGKKQWIIFAIVVAVLLTGAASAWWFLIRGTADRRVTEVKEEPYQKPVPKPTLVPSKLSGLDVDPAVNLRPVTSVMIENSIEARPQAGLKDASIVFEAIAEGGITRFNALYQDTQPDYIGPVRSVRPYYIDWFLPFDGALAHAGGSPKGLSDMKSLGAKDLDQFSNSGAYMRVNNRYAPHNLYTSIAKLNELEAKKGYTSANFTGFDRKKEAASTAPTARAIDLKISSTLYNVHYDYDPATNSYKRSEGGKIHIDERSGTQLLPKVVLAIVMQRGIDSDGQHTAYVTTGSGKLFVFQDGAITEGTWGKVSRSAQWTFSDAAGKPIAFNPGQTWISMVDTAGSVTYKP